MKNKFLFGILAIFAFAFVAFSFDRAEDEKLVISESKETVVYENAASAPNFYAYPWPLDTITNAANDTLYFPGRLRPVMSDFIQSYSITRTSISGTANVAVKIEESNHPYTGSTPPTLGWVTAINNLGAAADTDATTATEELIKLPASYGVSYRVIVDGTGTQSTSYRVRVVLKKK